MLTKLLKDAAAWLGLTRSDDRSAKSRPPGPQPRQREENDWVRRLQRHSKDKR